MTSTTAKSGVGGASVAAIVTALIVAEFTSAFELTMIYAALKTLYVVFADPQAVGWLITAYLLVSAAAAAICGKLGDMFGRKRVLLFVLCGALVGSVISAMSSDLGWIIAGRAVQGLAGAILPLCFGLAREMLPEDKVSYGVSAVGSTAVIAAGIGMLVGGIIIDHMPWHAIFYFSGTFALIAILVVTFLLPRSATTGTGGSVDFVGGLLFIPAIWGVLLAASKGNEWGWAAPATLGFGAVGVVLFAIWVRHELRIAHPLVNLRMLGKRELALANLGMFLYGLGPVQAQLHMLLMQQPTWTGVGAGLSPTLAGVLTLPGQVVSFLAAPFVGLLCRRLGARNAMLVSGTCLSLGWIGVLLMPTNLWMLVLSGPILAFGTVIIYSAVPNVVVAATPSCNTAESTGVTQIARASAQAIGAQVIALLLASSTVSSAEHPGVFPSLPAAMLAIGYVLLMSLGIAACAALLPRRHHAGAASPHIPRAVPTSKLAS